MSSYYADKNGLTRLGNHAYLYWAIKIPSGVYAPVHSYKILYLCDKLEKNISDRLQYSHKS